MFAEKNVCPNTRIWGYGVLVLLMLAGGLTGCSTSSHAPETDKLYSSEEAVTPEGTTETAVSPAGPALANQTPAPAPVIAIPKPSYSAADREVVIRYAEKGESDSANMAQALKLVQQAEQRSHSERTMEDYLILAAHYWYKGDLDQVVQQANQGIMSKSDSKRVKANMFIYLGYTYEKKSPTMARSYFNQAARIDPNYYKGHYESGRVAFEKKDYSSAKDSFNKVFTINLESADVYGMLGQMFYKMDQYEEAAESLEKALAISPQTPWIHLKLAEIYFYGVRKREMAGPHYQQAVSANSSDPEAHYGIALYYRYKNEYEKADVHLQKAMTLDFRNPKYKRELDDMVSEQEEMRKGIKKYKQAISKNPKDPRPVAQLGSYYLRWGKYDKAEKQYKKAVELASRLPQAPVAKPGSGTPADPVAQEPSKVPEHANSLGWFYFNDRKYAQAEEAFKIALKVNPKHTPAQFGLGRTYETLEQYDLAASHYVKAAALDPDNEEAQKRLDALKESGKLMPIGEIIKTQEKNTSNKSVLKVRK